MLQLSNISKHVNSDDEQNRPPNIFPRQYSKNQTTASITIPAHTPAPRATNARACQQSLCPPVYIHRTLDLIRRFVERGILASWIYIRPGGSRHRSDSIFAEPDKQIGTTPHGEGRKRIAYVRGCMYVYARAHTLFDFEKRSRAPSPFLVMCDGGGEPHTEHSPALVYMYTRVAMRGRRQYRFIFRLIHLHLLRRPRESFDQALQARDFCSKRI